MNTYQTILNIYPFHRIPSIFHYSHQLKSPFPGKTGFIPPEKAIPEGTGKRTTRQHPGCPPAISPHAAAFFLQTREKHSERRR